ncbi:MAG: polyisoprenoid-binding protein [Caulobacteraceae bacterium]|nr:polyisoprenoid-binding protein [Caulobacteraceae bacterium]
MKPLYLPAFAALAVLAACSQPAADKAAETPDANAATPAAPAADPSSVAAGAYKVDAAHTSVTFQVSHLGFSNYTGRFEKAEINANLDPANPANSTVEASIDPRSLSIPSPPAGFVAELVGPQWLDAAKFPAITFKSTKVEPTGANTARVTGDFTLHGVTKPVVLDVVFNGGYKGMAGMDPNSRAGFSATGSFKRSDFGIAYGVPAPGTTMGVSDEVKVAIETELTGPPLVSGEAGEPAPKG